MDVPGLSEEVKAAYENFKIVGAPQAANAAVAN
jgi:hypothetical protein